MRISDWSSDVCSSDLGSSANLAALLPPAGEGLPDVRSRRLGSRPRGRFIRGAVRCHAADARKPSMKYSRAALLPSPWAAGLLALLLALPRSEERRVGKVWGSTCRSRGSPYH